MIRYASITTVLAVMLLPEPVAAHDDGVPTAISIPNACLEPLKPIVSAYVERGEGSELRRDFEVYFKEVETYLNCLNAERSRVMVEAQRAAYELDQVFDRFPDGSTGPSLMVERPPMVSSGYLNLDYRGAGG